MLKQNVTTAPARTRKRKQRPMSPVVRASIAAQRDWEREVYEADPTGGAASRY